MPSQPTLAREIPFPVARLWRQSRNAKSATESHNRAWFAWETSIRLAVIARNPGALASLRSASVGDWARSVPRGAKNISQPELLRLHLHLARAADPQAGLRSSIGPREFLDALVAYRNRVIGHGPSRDEAFCREGASLLRDGLLVAWENEVFLPAQARLVFVEAVEITSGGQRVARVLDLGLETPTILEPDSIPVPETVRPHRVFLRGDGHWADLSPWLQFDAQTAAFFVFQTLRRRPDYIDYSSGSVLDREALARLDPTAEDELRRAFEGRVANEDPAHAPASASSRFGEYEILGEIGRGGMGVVYLANQVRLSRLVALKTLPEQSRGDPVLRARFHREIEALARCEHPNVVKIHTSGEQDGVPYFAMEFVSGTDLRRVGAGLTQTKSMERALDLAWKEVLEERRDLAEVLPKSSAPVLNRLNAGDRYRAAAVLIRDAALGVQALHDAGIVHRDLSPANILVTSGEARAVVMDLGLAMLQDGNRSLSRDHKQILGTLRYMPPEQLQRNLLQVDRRADVYALGAVLYELLSDAPFFDGDTEERLIEQVLREAPHPIRKIDPGIPRDLATIVQVATDKDPRLRYATASALAEDLDAFLQARPIAARTPSPWYVTWKWAARNPGLAAASVVGAVGVVAGVAVATNLNRMRLEEAERADEYVDFGAARHLLDDYPRLPRNSGGLAEIDSWIARARALVARKAEFEARASEASSPSLGSVVVAAGAQSEGGGIDLTSVSSPTSGGSRARAAEVVKCIEELESKALPRVEADRIVAAELQTRSIDSQGEAWARCRADLARRAADSPYPADFMIAPQEGLVPLGIDPQSGLQEFVHVQSGAVPGRDTAGRLRFDGASGIVLVLLPGGSTWIGVARDEGEPYYDASVRWSDAPLHEVKLDSYFISKFEVTQAQWLRLTGTTSSINGTGGTTSDEKHRFGPTSPVDNLSWKIARDVLHGFSLELPTEAQWEHAARAQSSSPWYFGSEISLIRDNGNIADRTLHEFGAMPGWTYSDDIEDGGIAHVLVGSYKPNSFGIYDVVGNVLELCQEARWYPYPLPGTTPAGTGHAHGSGLLVQTGDAGGSTSGIARGGSWVNPYYMTTSAHRYKIDAQRPDAAVGVRPARRVD